MEMIRYFLSLFQAFKKKYFCNDYTGKILKSKTNLRGVNIFIIYTSFSLFFSIFRHRNTKFFTHAVSKV